MLSGPLLRRISDVGVCTTRGVVPMACSVPCNMQTNIEVSSAPLTREFPRFANENKGRVDGVIEEDRGNVHTNRVKMLGNLYKRRSDVLSLETSFRPAGCRDVPPSSGHCTSTKYRRRSLGSGPRPRHWRNPLRPVLLSLAFRPICLTKDAIGI